MPDQTVTKPKKPRKPDLQPPAGWWGGWGPAIVLAVVTILVLVFLSRKAQREGTVAPAATRNGWMEQRP